jgi:signal peptidase I
MANYTNTKKQGFWSSTTEFVGLLLLVILIRTFGFGLYQVPTGSMETTMLVGGRFFADKVSYLFRSPTHGEIISFNDPEHAYSSNKLLFLFQNYFWGPANWTKRVIGLPGDHIEGRIEDGKPVVYRNGEKLNESYLNKYPLVHVANQDVDLLYSKIRNSVQQKFGSSQVSDMQIQYFVDRELSSCYRPKSYDPSVSFDDQPFYRINDRRVLKDAQGQIVMLKPQTLLRPVKRDHVLDVSRNQWDGTDVFSIHLGDGQYWCMGDNRLGSRDCRSFGPVDESFIHGRILFCIWSHDSDEAWFILDLLKHPIDFWYRMRWSRCLRWIS